MNRRDFMRKTTYGTGLAASYNLVPGFAAGGATPEQDMQPSESQKSDAAGLPLVTSPGTRKGEMLYRTLGRTGEQVSAIGMGGFHIGHIQDEQESIKLVRTGIHLLKLGKKETAVAKCSPTAESQGSKLIDLWSHAADERAPVSEHTSRFVRDIFGR